MSKKSLSRRNSNVSLSSVSSIRPSSVQDSAPSVKSVEKSEMTKTFHNISKSSKLKVKKIGKKIDGFTSSYVGFRPPDFRSLHDLSHLRHFVEAHASSEQAISVLESLDTMLKSIPTDKYDSSDPPTKLDTIKQLIDAYNFAWNEATLQLKSISEEHAEVFSKIKTFYMFLLEEYPHLLTDYQKQVSGLKKLCGEKDQHIKIINQEILMFNQRDNEIREFTASLRDEIKRIKERKSYFKQELNNSTLECDRLKEELTELRCKIAKEIENSKGKISLLMMDDLAESTSLLIDKEPEVVLIDEGTDPISFELSPVPMLQDLKKKPIVQNPDAIVLPDDFGSKLESNSALRHVVYSFMINEIKLIEPKMKADANAEMKKFYWIFPKILSIFITGIQFEDSKHPFTTFEELLMCFLTNHYQTSYLIQQIYSSLVQSSSLLDGVNHAIHLFNQFIKIEYDFYQYRFFNTILEFSVCYTTPDITTIVMKEGITAEEANINIPKSKAREVYHACFPFKDHPKNLNDGPNNTETHYWSFLDMMIQEFDECRQHFWAVLKNALLLSDCPDSKHISLNQFASFMGIIFPRIPLNIVKMNWKALLVRDAASLTKERDSRFDMLEFSSLTYFCSSKDENISVVMKIHTSKNFASAYYEMNAPMLEIISFIVNRLTYYIPTISAQIPEIQTEFDESTLKIRDALFICDVTLAIASYRMLLHKIDYLAVKDYASMTISKNSTIKEMAELIAHMKLREKVTGIMPSPTFTK